MKRQQATVLTLLALTLSGCGVTAAPSIQSPTLSTMRASALTAPTTKDGFIKAVAALGVKLTAAQLDTISANRAAKPNGTWAARPAVNLTGEQNLQTHFLKHGQQFRPGIKSAQDYLAQAIALAEGKRGAIQYYFDITSFDKGYQSNVVIWNSSSKELTAMRPDGAMTTYYCDPALKSNRFVIVPAF